MNNSDMKTGMKAIKTLYYFWHIQPNDEQPVDKLILKRYVFEETAKTYKIGWEEEWKEGQGMYLSTIKKSEMQTGSQGGFYFETYEDALRGLSNFLVRKIEYIEKEVDRLLQDKGQYIGKFHWIQSVISKGGKA